MTYLKQDFPISCQVKVNSESDREMTGGKGPAEKKKKNRNNNVHLCNLDFWKMLVLSGAKKLKVQQAIYYSGI